MSSRRRKAVEDSDSEADEEEEEQEQEELSPSEHDSADSDGEVAQDDKTIEDNTVARGSDEHYEPALSDAYPLTRLEDEIDPAHEEHWDGVEELDQTQADTKRTVDDRDAKPTQMPEKKTDPAFVPTRGVFYLHDDRESGKSRGHSRKESQRIPHGQGKAKDTQKWQHDKFQEVENEERTTSRSKTGRQRKEEKEVTREPRRRNYKPTDLTPDYHRVPRERQPKPNKSTPPHPATFSSNKPSSVMIAGTCNTTEVDDVRKTTSLNVRSSRHPKRVWQVKATDPNANTSSRKITDDSAPEITPQLEARDAWKSRQADGQQGLGRSPSLALQNAAGAPEFKPANFSAGTSQSSVSSPRALDVSANPPLQYDYAPGQGEWMPVVGTGSSNPIMMASMWDHGMSGSINMMPQSQMPVEMSTYGYGVDPNGAPSLGLPTGLFVQAPQMMYMTDQSGNSWYADTGSLGWSVGSSNASMSLRDGSYTSSS